MYSKLRILFVILISISLFSACKESSDDVSIPSDVLNEGEMVGLMIDIHLTDVIVEDMQLGSRDSLLAVSKEHYQIVFKNHGTTEEEYKNSLEFYKKNPPILDKIYDEVLKELSDIEVKLYE